MPCAPYAVYASPTLATKANAHCVGLSRYIGLLALGVLFSIVAWLCTSLRNRGAAVIGSIFTWLHDMKNGEKTALWLAFTAIATVIGLALIFGGDNKPTTPDSQVANASAAHAVAVVAIPPGLTADDLPDAGSAGAKTLAVYCVQCHDLPPPYMHAAAEWDTVLARMRTAMQERRGGMLSRVMTPSDGDWELMRAYLAQHGQRALDLTKAAGLDTPAGQTFLAVCSQCHAAPDPSQHTAREWPRIVVRMKANMAAAKIPAPKDERLQSVIDYLQQHAAAGA